jgi:hypothetical protein
MQNRLLWERAMDMKHRLAGFKALLESHKTNSYHLIDPEGEFRLWQDLSAEGRLDIIARDAAYYDVPFEQFAEAARAAVDRGAMEEAALRLAVRSGRELHDLEQLFPDDGRTEPPPPLVERVSELLNAVSPEPENEVWLTAKEQTALFKEMRADEAAGKREEANWLAREAFETILDRRAEALAVEKGKDKGIER